MNSGEELLHKADNLMVRLNSLLNVENEKNIGDILINLKAMTGKFADLQKNIDKALAGIPVLTKDAQKTLANMNTLAHDLQGLTREVQNLSINAGNLVNTGENAGDILTQTTLPKVNKLLTELQSAAQQVKRTAAMLDNYPQALLLGPDQHNSGPGEPGYKEPK
jgi:phospholipid/cholesterol/gamma-HCH transport system substrate-binding protein